MSPMDRVQSRPLSRQTLVEGAYDILKARLMDNELPAGVKLNMEALGRELGVSPTPIREAMAALEREGLVTKTPLVGYAVADRLDHEGFERLWEARIILEPAVARLAADRHTAQELAAIQSCVEPISAAGGPGYADYKRIAQLDEQFHSAIARASHNPTLTDWFDRTHFHVHLYRLHPPHGDELDVWTEHQRIATALQEGDAEAAAATMTDHLVRARERIRPVFAG